MAINRTNILRGPGTLIFGSGQDAQTIFDATGITADVENSTQDIPSSVSGTLDQIKTDQVGTVSEVLVQSGNVITQGNEIIRVSPRANSRQVIVCYVALSDSKKIARGMQVSISLSSAESQTYGHMLGRVINIDSHAASNQGMSYVLGTDNNLASLFSRDVPAVVAVTCELYPDAETTSGYYWSNAKGARLEVTNGSLVSAKVVVEEVRPITKLFSKLKEIWGD